MKHTIKLNHPKPVAPEPARAFGDSDQAQSGTREPTTFSEMQGLGISTGYILAPGGTAPTCHPSGFAPDQHKSLQELRTAAQAEWNALQAGAPK